MNELLLSLGKKLVFWILKHFNKKVLKKYFPFDENDLKVELSTDPHIFINEKENFCIFSFNILIKNYTNYEVYIPSSMIEIQLIDTIILRKENLILRSFKYRQGQNISKEYPLTYYQVQKIKHLMSPKTNNMSSIFKVTLPVKTELGERMIYKTINKQLGISLS